MNQTTFAKWLNEIPVTCKEDQRYCLRYEDIRFNRYNPYIDKTIPDNQPIPNNELILKKKYQS